MPNNDNMVLFGSKAPDVYLKSTIATNTGVSGKFVPTVGSIVIDSTNTVDGKWTLEVVEVVSVSPTGVVTIKYGNPVIKADNLMYDRFMDYGNDTYMMFYSDVWKPSTGPYAGLDIRTVYLDDKFAIYASDDRVFKIVTADSTGVRIEVSRNMFDISATYTNTVRAGNTADGMYRQTFGVCYVMASELPGMADGLPFYVEVYDKKANGTPNTLRGIGAVMSKSAFVPNVTTNGPIVELTLDTNQDMTNRDAYLYQNQDVSALAYFVGLRYANGQRESIGINNSSIVLYGQEVLTSGYVGTRFELLCKYFVPSTTPALIGTIADGMRVLQATKMVEVIPLDSYQFSKVSLIPIWNSTTSTWSFMWYGSTDTGSCNIPINQITYLQNSLIGTPNEIQQHVQVQVADNMARQWTFDVYYKMMAGDGEQFFNITDALDSSFVYGKVAEGSVSPTITRVQTASYTSFQFDATKYTSIDMFLNTFFYAANPPELLDQSNAPIRPTHFIIRNAAGTVLTAEPQLISAFGTSLRFTGTTPGVTPATPSVNDTLIMEFITIAGSNPWVYHYAVPIMVRA